MNKVAQDTLKATKGDIRAAISALEDGQYLTDAGYTDDEQSDIEDAHADLKAMLQNDLPDRA